MGRRQSVDHLGDKLNTSYNELIIYPDCNLSQVGLELNHLAAEIITLYKWYCVTQNFTIQVV